jgi:hypothetical protein
MGARISSRLQQSSGADDAVVQQDDFRNWLGWASGPRNAMKIGAAE